jgi:tetratricopeptide (TPR) repeat protein
LTNWAFGSRLYDWGYTSYVNPYIVTVPRTQTIVVPYNYSQPINTEVPPPPEDESATAEATFDEARESFKAGRYDQALDLSNKALAVLPNDPAVHEFRALVLFALGRYEEASQVIYPVLSVGPGWDWTTMVGLYPDQEMYTSQLSALENYVQSHPQQASPRFLLAYHYLTLSYPDDAADQLREVVRLKPADKLSGQMLSLLEAAQKQTTETQGQSTAETATAEQPIAEPTAALPPEIPSPAGKGADLKLAELLGSWQAKSDDETTITLTLKQDNTFAWQVDQNGQTRQLDGKYSVAGDVLTLAQDNGGAMVGNASQSQPNQFAFRAMGAPASDPGLTFVRQ